MGFDASINQFTNLIQAGVIDPTKVVRRTIQDAASVASLMITTECMIVDEPPKQG